LVGDIKHHLRERASWCLVFLVLLTQTAVLLMTTQPAPADQRSDKWNEVRYAGLIEFSKGHYDAARLHFEKALALSRTPKPDGEKETLSTYDLAQVYEYMGKRNKEAELYYRRALTLAKHAFPPHSAEVTLMLTQLASLLKVEHRDVEEHDLRQAIDKNIAEHPQANFIGAASMDKDGQITMYMRATGANTEGHAIFNTKKTDPGYKETVLHLGPMKAGEQRFILPYRNDPNAPEPVVPPLPPPRAD